MFAALLAVVLFAGVSVRASEIDNRGGSSASGKISDASITAQVKRALLTHSSTSAVKTKISTKNGVVTLNGIAKNDAEKALVNKLACDVTGVVSVLNQMTVADKSGKGIDKKVGKSDKGCEVCGDLKDAMKCPLKNGSVAHNPPGE